MCGCLDLTLIVSFLTDMTFLFLMFSLIYLSFVQTLTLSSVRIQTKHHAFVHTSV